MLSRPPTSPLFPYTTLFRSVLLIVRRRVGRDAVQQGEASRAAFTRAGHGRGHLVERGQPGRDEQRLARGGGARRSEEHTSELQSPCNLVCRLLLEKKKTK